MKNYKLLYKNEKIVYKSLKGGSIETNTNFTYELYNTYFGIICSKDVSHILLRNERDRQNNLILRDYQNKQIGLPPDEVFLNVGRTL